MIRTMKLVVIQLVLFAAFGCATDTYRSRGSIDLSKSKTIYIELFENDRYGFSREVVNRLSEIGFKSVDNKDKADLVLNWRYSTTSTSVRFLFEDKNGITAYLGVCVDPVEKGEDATWICIERALTDLSQ